MLGYWARSLMSIMPGEAPPQAPLTLVDSARSWVSSSRTAWKCASMPWGPLPEGDSAYGAVAARPDAGVGHVRQDDEVALVRLERHQRGRQRPAHQRSGARVPVHLPVALRHLQHHEVPGLADRVGPE